MTKFGRDYENLLHFIQFRITPGFETLDSRERARSAPPKRRRTEFIESCSEIDQRYFSL